VTLNGGPEEDKAWYKTPSSDVRPIIVAYWLLVAAGIAVMIGLV
jgi:hypothetical protein